MYVWLYGKSCNHAIEHDVAGHKLGQVNEPPQSHCSDNIHDYNRHMHIYI